ncbi:MAG: efflux RND transporter periplasmic adaptor subunit [Candidatus Omnitrophica bacterium]|nr:efflux RND transporter periplasmic adaptor subunit [Candidatus Omnitrophota bacterium]
MIPEDDRSGESNEDISPESGGGHRFHSGFFKSEFPYVDFPKILAFLGTLFRAAARTLQPVLRPVLAFIETRFPWIKTHRKGAIAALVFLFLGILIVSNFLTKNEAGKLKQEKAEEAGGRQDAIPVKVFPVKRFNYEDSLKSLGTVKGAIEFKLSFEIPGVINSVNYREGEHYEEGALLISLRQDDILLNLKRAQANYNKAQTAYKIAQEKLKEHGKLFDIGAIPKSTLEQVKLELESAQYEAEASQLEAKAQEAMLEKTNLYAVSDGMIGELNIEEGEAITPNSLIGTHVFTEYVLIEFGVVEREVNKLALGQRARVFVDAYPEKAFDGTVENISPVVAGTSRTATVRVRVENPEGLLLPGMFARIKILIYNKKNAIAVPTEAVLGKKDEAYVFVADEETSTAVKKPVKIGYQREDYTQIDSGITDGDLVIIHGYEKLEDGTKIKVLEKQEIQL